jgi:hypothetical protein
MRTITQLPLQALAGEQEFELALAQLLFCGQIADRLPVAAVPQLHGAAAVCPCGIVPSKSP